MHPPSQHVVNCHVDVCMSVLIMCMCMCMYMLCVLFVCMRLCVCAFVCMYVHPGVCMHMYMFFVCVFVCLCCLCCLCLHVHMHARAVCWRVHPTWNWWIQNYHSHTNALISNDLMKACWLNPGFWMSKIIYIDVKLPCNVLCRTCTLSDLKIEWWKKRSLKMSGNFTLPYIGYYRKM